MEKELECNTCGNHDQNEFVMIGGMNTYCGICNSEDLKRNYLYSTVQGLSFGSSGPINAVQGGTYLTLDDASAPHMYVPQKEKEAQKNKKKKSIKNKVISFFKSLFTDDDDSLQAPGRLP